MKKGHNKRGQQNLRGELDEARIRVYQEAYLAWVVARRETLEGQRIEHTTKGASESSNGSKVSKGQENNPTPSQPGYEWHKVRNNWYAGGARRQAQEKLLRESYKYQHKLWKKGKTLCYTPEEDWTEDLLPTTTPAETERDVAVQTVHQDYFDYRLPSEVSTDAVVTGPRMVERSSQTDIGLLELSAPQTSVSVDAPAQEKFSFWLNRKKVLMNEMSLVQREIDKLVEEFMESLNQVSQPSNYGD